MISLPYICNKTNETMKEKIKFIGSVISDTATLTLVVAGITLAISLGTKIGNTISDKIYKGADKK